MDCPFCGTANIDGDDFCQTCSQPLTDLVPAPMRKTGLEASIEADTLEVLEPVKPVTVSPTDSVEHALSLLATRNIGCVLVVWVDALVGIFSERDALTKIGPRYNKEVAKEPVRHYMTPAPETLTLKDTIAFALNRMAVGDFRHVPIERDEKPVGIVSVRDVLGYLTRHFPEILAETA